MAPGAQPGISSRNLRSLQHESVLREATGMPREVVLHVQDPQEMTQHRARRSLLSSEELFLVGFHGRTGHSNGQD